MPSIVESAQVKQWALQLGFDLVGVAPAQALNQEHHLHFQRYLAREYQGQMHYLESNFDKRLDPSQLVPGARSIICTAVNYYNPQPQPGGGGQFGRVARYAWVADYHVVLKDKLRKLADNISTASGRKAHLRCFVDTAPLAEKAHAANAGLGWIGKNGLLINERFGSWLVLGEIVTNLPLEGDQPVVDRCGTCRRCLEACPTAALLEPRVLEARRCISYQTVEADSPIPADLRHKAADWLFGCDVCQEVCPFNEHAQPTALPEFAPQPQWRCPPLAELMNMDEEQFRRWFAGSSMSRVGCEQLKLRAKDCYDFRQSRG